MVSPLTCDHVFLLQVQTLTGAPGPPCDLTPAPGPPGRLPGWGAMPSFAPPDFICQTQVRGEVVKCQDGASRALPLWSEPPAKRRAPCDLVVTPQGATPVAEEGQAQEDSDCRSGAWLHRKVGIGSGLGPGAAGRTAQAPRRQTAVTGLRPGRALS